MNDKKKINDTKIAKLEKLSKKQRLTRNQKSYLNELRQFKLEFDNILQKGLDVF